MKKLCIITGATSGIGLELAKLFSCENIQLLLISSNLDNLKRTKMLLENKLATIDILEMDLANNFSIEKIKEKIKDKQLYCLINNAGFGDLNSFILSDLEKAENMIKLNNIALTKLCHFFLNETKESTDPIYLLNVASIAGFMPGPLMAVYYATKAYTLSFTRALRYEMRKKKNIRICCLCPGPTKTNFTKDFIKKPKIFSNIFSMQAKDVAITAYYGLLKNKELIIPGVLNYIAIKIIPFIPNKLISAITNKIMKIK